MRTKADFELAGEYMRQYRLDKLAAPGPLSPSGIKQMGEGIVGGLKRLVGKGPKVAPRPLPGGVAPRVMHGPIPSERELASLPKAFPTAISTGAAATKPGIKNIPGKRGPTGTVIHQGPAPAATPAGGAGAAPPPGAIGAGGAKVSPEELELMNRQFAAGTTGVPEAGPKVIPGQAKAAPAAATPPPLPSRMPTGTYSRQQLAQSGVGKNPFRVAGQGGVKPWEWQRGTPIDLGGGRVVYTSATWNKLTETMSKFAAVYAHSPIFQLRMGA